MIKHTGTCKQNFNTYLVVSSIGNLEAQLGAQFDALEKFGYHILRGAGTEVFQACVQLIVAVFEEEW